MIRCQCIGCSRPAHRNVGGRMVCDPCYLKDGHLFFSPKKPFPTLRVLMTIIAVLVWLIMDVATGQRNVIDLACTALSSAILFNVFFEVGRRLGR